jgi:thioredoxin 1
LLAGWLVGIIASAGFAQTAPRPPEFPAKGMVTLVDLGATECIPCKMMAPILRDLAREYEGKAAVIFIDVWKNPAPARQTGIRVIPTQIFYDKQGKEVGRHEGFLDKKSIVAAFEKLGVK